MQIVVKPQNTYGNNIPPQPLRRNHLLPGDSMHYGDFLISDNGLFTFGMDNQGSFTVYDHYQNPIYSLYEMNPGEVTANVSLQYSMAVIPGNGSQKSVITEPLGFIKILVNDQTPPNPPRVVYYTTTANPSNDDTHTNPGYFALQNDGSLAVISNNKILWSLTPPNDGLGPAVPILTRNTLFGGDRLLPGDFLLSENKQFRMVYQTDGELAIYMGPSDSNSTVLWGTDSPNTPLGMAIMQNDGNFVLYGFTGNNSRVVNWALDRVFGTKYQAGSYLRLENSGDVIIYGPDGSIVWNSNVIQYSNRTSDARPINVQSDSNPPTCPAVFTVGEIDMDSMCGAVLSAETACGAVLTAVGFCAGVFSAASLCAENTAAAGICVADVSFVGICGAVAALGAASVVAISGAGACGFVATVGAACGAVYGTVGATIVGASGASACGAAACGAVACGAAACGAAACGGEAVGLGACGSEVDGFKVCGGEASGVGVCGSNTGGDVEAVGMCGAVEGFCGLVLCVALPVGGNW